MQVTVLGSGSAQPTQRRASSGYLVEWRFGALLLDASAGTYMRALKAGLDPFRLRAVVLSHLHPDHTADLPGILWARKQTPDLTSTLTVAGPEGTAEFLARLDSVYGDWLATPREVRSFPCECDGLAILAYPARHPGESVCLRLTAGGKTLAYSGDTGDCEGLRAACRTADLALLECTQMEASEGHLTPADCEAVVAAAQPRRVLLTHLGPDVTPTLPIAEDGMVVSP
ncbi:MAG: MBL fold metallo-hydrolase [Planctomycetota bacterium]